MSTVIGLMGQKRAGKDAFAEFLVKDHGFTRLAFADVMREALLALDPMVADWVTTERLSVIINRVGWDRAKEAYPEVRRLLQVFGTELGRNILGEDVWVEALHSKLADALEAGKDVVITDVRFGNEAVMVLEHAGWLIRLERKELPDEDQHASEQAWRDITPDIIVMNDGTLAELGETAEEILSFLKHTEVCEGCDEAIA